MNMTVHMLGNVDYEESAIFVGKFDEAPYLKKLKNRPNVLNLISLSQIGQRALDPRMMVRSKGMMIAKQ